MAIYGSAILAFSLVCGLLAGRLLGLSCGIDANVGGVGIAMLLLISARTYLHKRGLMPNATEAGVGFWAAMYIPVVVAMAAQQNVVAALKGGPVAVISAVGAVLLCGCTIAIINRANRAGPKPEDAAWQTAAVAEET